MNECFTLFVLPGLYALGIIVDAILTPLKPIQTPNHLLELHAQHHSLDTFRLVHNTHGQMGTVLKLCEDDGRGVGKARLGRRGRICK